MKRIRESAEGGGEGMLDQVSKETISTGFSTSMFN
jgi:hypothetical protein